MPHATSHCLGASRQEEFTARLMGHTEPKLAGGLRMKAFYESPYGDHVVANLMNHEVRVFTVRVCDPLASHFNVLVVSKVCQGETFIFK